MLGGEAGAARVRRVVDKDGAGLRGDLALEVLEVDLPAFLRHQVVVVPLDTQILANWLTEREAGLGHEDTVTHFAHD